MLVNFEVSNYKSFKEKTMFSMEATSIKKFPENTFKFCDQRYVKSVAIYGYNESGKSNLFSAINKMRDIVLNSTREEPDYTYNISNFLLDDNYNNIPTEFSITFILDKIRYQYMFSVLHNKVKYERLTRKKERVVTLFDRHSNINSNINININSNYENVWRRYADLTGENTLLLSRMANLGEPLAKQIRQWFLDLTILYGDNSSRNLTTKYISENDENKNKVIRLLKLFNIQINDLNVENLEVDINELNKIINVDFFKKKSNFFAENFIEIKTLHYKYNNYKLSGNIAFDLLQESTGTRKVFDLAASIIETLEKGSTLFIDELDTKLHPLIIKGLFNIFNKGNNNRAQFIVISHLPNLLSWEVRHDQIWIARKNIYGESTIARVNEIDDIRADKNLMNYFIADTFI